MNTLRRKPLWQLMPDIEVSVKGHAVNEGNKRKLWFIRALFKAGTVKQGGWELPALVTEGWVMRIGQGCWWWCWCPSLFQPRLTPSCWRKQTLHVVHEAGPDVLYTLQVYCPTHCSEMSQAKDWLYHEEKRWLLFHAGASNTMASPGTPLLGMGLLSALPPSCFQQLDQKLIVFIAPALQRQSCKSSCQLCRCQAWKQKGWSEVCCETFGFGIF